MLKALRYRALRRLWIGQATSSIGDEIYRVGLTWIAVGIIGEDTGYINASQAAALMIMSFIGGKWADQWDHLKTMVRIDLVRALIVLVPVCYSYIAPVPLSLLVVTAIVLSGLGAFFDPALQATLPKFSPDVSVLQAANGLMMTVSRMARMLGPALIGFLSGILPPIHFFTLDALSFFVSATMVQSLESEHLKKHVKVPRRRIPYREAIFSGFQAVRGSHGMSFILFTKNLTTGTWHLAYSLGFALLVQEIAAHDIRSYGMVMAAYGAGNFAGALYFGNRARRRPALMMFTGYVWMGIGFVVTSFCKSIEGIMLVSAISAFSGTMNEVTFFDLVQTKFDHSVITKIFRLRTALDQLSMLILMLIAPFLFRGLGVRTVILVCGALWIATGLAGIVRFYLRPTSRAGFEFK